MAGDCMEISDRLSMALKVNEGSFVLRQPISEALDLYVIT